MKYTRISIFIISFLILSLSTQVSMAQMVATDEPFDIGASADGTGPVLQESPPDPCVGPDANCPIDGGVIFLIAAGVGLAGKRAYKQKKDNKTVSQ